MSPSDGLNPWRFLTALDGSRKTDREVIEQTRKEELDLVNHMIMGAKTSILYAASGNGKTSLLSAGIIPYFVGLGYAVFRTRPRPPWSVDDPIQAFEECMIREQWLPESAPQSATILEAAKEQLQAMGAAEDSPARVLVAQLEAQLLRLSQTADERSAELKTSLRPKVGCTSLLEFLRSTQSLLGSQIKMLLICDQFEELFVHFTGTQKLQEYVKQIGEVCKSDNVRAQFLFSMREDWVGSMIEFRSTIPDIFSLYYKLPPMRTEKALPALQLPLAEAGHSMEDSVAKRILLDLADCYPLPEDQDTARRLERISYFELPALQIVAEALWNSRNAIQPPFTLDHYKLLGQLHGARPAEN